MSRIRVPQTDPHASYVAYRGEIDEAVARVLDGGRYILGSEVEAFEQEFADAMGASHGIGVANGTDALLLALEACGIGEGDLVYTVSHTAVATVAAIEITGATPVLVDIDPVSFTMHPAALEAAIRKTQSGTPRAVLPVHLYGNPADLTAIAEIASRYGLDLIEDCAQSHGAQLGGRNTGTWGRIASYSFYPTKNLGAFGDGGMVVTSERELADRVRLLRQYGWKERYVSEIPGGNSRLDEIHAAVLRVKLRYLRVDNERRRSIASKYRGAFDGLDLALPVERSGALHVYHQFVVRHANRDELRSHLDRDGIGTLIHYAVPVHLQPAYCGRIPLGQQLVETERAANEIVSLPMFPQLSDNQVDQVCASVRSFLST